MHTSAAFFVPGAVFGRRTGTDPPPSPPPGQRAGPPNRHRVPPAWPQPLAPAGLSLPPCCALPGPALIGWPPPPPRQAGPGVVPASVVPLPRPAACFPASGQQARVLATLPHSGGVSKSPPPPEAVSGACLRGRRMTSYLFSV